MNLRYVLLIMLSILFWRHGQAQYPTSGVKQRLGYQTTGDGLVFRGNGSPAYTPSGINSAWAYIDTTAGTIYTYYAGSWHLVSAGGGTSFDGHVDSLVFNTAVTATDSVGKMYYDAANETISVGIDGGAVYQLGQELYYPLVINKSGATIHNGQPVMVDTATLVTGDHVRIIPARNGATYPSEYVMGVATADIPNDSTGLVTWFGYVREVKQSDIAQTGVTIDAGEILYLSSTEPGKYTDTPPTSPAHKSTIALVVRKPSVNNITLLVRPWLAPKLDNLSNVNVTSVAGLSVLRYNSTTGIWDASATPGIVAADTSAMLSYYLRKVDTLSLSNRIDLKLNIADTASMLVPYQKDITLTTSGTSGAATFNGVTLNVPQYQAALTNPVTGTGIAGQVAYWSGTTTQTGNNNLFYDATNARLGIGTNAPGGKITAYSNTNGRVAIENWNISTGADAYAVLGNYVGNSSTGDSNFRLSSLITFPKNYTNATFGGAYAAGGTTLWMYGASDTTNNNMTFAITQTVPNLSEANYNPSFRWVKAITNNYTIANELMRLNKTGLGIKQNTPLYTLDINATDGIRIPAGTTAHRPTGAAGVMRYNYDSLRIEYHTGTAWKGIAKTEELPVVTSGFPRAAPVAVILSTYTVGATDAWIICDYAGTVTLTLPSAASYPGREIMVKTIRAQSVVSASSNVAPIDSNTAGTAILAATAGKWATLVSTGLQWIIMQSN